MTTDWTIGYVIGGVILLAVVALVAAILVLRYTVFGRSLYAIRRTLRALTGGVQVVDQLTSTVPARLTSVNANLKPVRDFCETV